MNIRNLPDHIKIYPGVMRTIKTIALSDKKTAGRIVQRIIELRIDPLPMTEECDSETVWNLTKKKVYVKRLKCIDISDYRIFYAYKKSGLICVYCVIRRDKDTYKKDSSHYTLIKLLYTQWRQCQ